MDRPNGTIAAGPAVAANAAGPTGRYRTDQRRRARIGRLCLVRSITDRRGMPTALRANGESIPQNSPVARSGAEDRAELRTEELGVAQAVA